MDNLKFNNTENKCIKDCDDEYWISRSSAVVAIILAHIEGNTFVLTGKRSKNMDQPGKQALVSGYFDWDENGWDAMRREVWEESQLDINSIQEHLVFNNNKQPYYVKTCPGENRQNLTLNYILEYDFGDVIPDCIEETSKFKSSEVDSVNWINIEDLNNYEWGFDHEYRILDALNFLDYTDRSKPAWDGEIHKVSQEG